MNQFAYDNNDSLCVKNVVRGQRARAEVPGLLINLRRFAVRSGWRWLTLTRSGAEFTAAKFPRPCIGSELRRILPLLFPGKKSRCDFLRVVNCEAPAWGKPVLAAGLLGVVNYEVSVQISGVRPHVILLESAISPRPDSRRGRVPHITNGNLGTVNLEPFLCGMGRVLPISSCPATLVVCVACPRGAVATVHVGGSYDAVSGGYFHSVDNLWFRPEYTGREMASIRIPCVKRTPLAGGFSVGTRNTVMLRKDIPEVTSGGSCHACLAGVSIQWTVAAGRLWRITSTWPVPLAGGF
ncbi:hypothetical protein EDD16DRAFT_1518650 [Pisolithus croceorrhizus]|nr:hypothetical protein EV401DRAFT_1894268 [Pisolithus croceorrhizus]KAI6120985.1 hypothetical protein EDD16DRAFT_1518650 [Pisolithus croceorrhizus]KAI6152755.1 hypothetical protein EDD17DRAFT_1513190 [Pisolithus thermaeus]